MILSDASREIIARFHLFKELQFKVFISLFACDNQKTFTISRNSINYQRIKHIDLRYHFIRHALEKKQIQIEYVFTSHQATNILTKAFDFQKYQQAIEMINLFNII